MLEWRQRQDSPNAPNANFQKPKCQTYYVTLAALGLEAQWDNRWDCKLNVHICHPAVLLYHITGLNITLAICDNPVNTKSTITDGQLDRKISSPGGAG